MRFLADECCDFAVVRALRRAGHDVRALAEETTRTDDITVIAEATREHRILITEDKDFGWIVFVAGASSPGVILVRFPANTRGTLEAEIVALVDRHGSELPERFTVLQPGVARITRRP